MSVLNFASIEQESPIMEGQAFCGTSSDNKFIVNYLHESSVDITYISIYQIEGTSIYKQQILLEVQSQTISQCHITQQKDAKYIYVYITRKSIIQKFKINVPINTFDYIQENQQIYNSTIITSTINPLNDQLHILFTDRIQSYEGTYYQDIAISSLQTDIFNQMFIFKDGSNTMTHYFFTLRSNQFMGYKIQEANSVIQSVVFEIPVSEFNYPFIDSTFGVEIDPLQKLFALKGRHIVYSFLDTNFNLLKSSFFIQASSQVKSVNSTFFSAIPNKIMVISDYIDYTFEACYCEYTFNEQQVIIKSIDACYQKDVGFGLIQILINQEEHYFYYDGVIFHKNRTVENSENQELYYPNSISRVQEEFSNQFELQSLFFVQETGVLTEISRPTFSHQEQGTLLGSSVQAIILQKPEIIIHPGVIAGVIVFIACILAILLGVYLKRRKNNQPVHIIEPVIESKKIISLESNNNLVRGSVLSHKGACCICLDEECDCILSCNHSFHRKCVEAWLDAHNDKCPRCRQYSYIQFSF